MLHSMKPFTCPCCNSAFTKDHYRNQNTSRFPLILKCGHTVCESCIRNFSKANQTITCQICQKSTAVDARDIPKLLPDVYALGVLNVSSSKIIPRSFDVKFTFPSQANEAKSHRNEAYVTCEHCMKNEASFRCQKCEENYCNTCFDEFHKKKSRQKHVGVPVYANMYSSMVQEGCIEHDNRAIEFYCEDDGSLTCSLCVVTGIHKGHSVLTLADKNKACSEELKLARAEACVVNKRLKLAEEKLASSVPCEKFDDSPLIKKIRENFHKLHSALILRESQLISEVEAALNSSKHDLEKLRQEVSDASKDLEAILKDAERVLENHTLSVSVPAIISKLQEAKSIPCHLVPNRSETKPRKIRLEFDSSLSDAVYSYGKVLTNITEPKFSLKSSSQLPENFIIEPLPATDNCNNVENDIESVTSDTISEDSLITCPSAPIMAPKQKEKQEYSASSPEKVFVCHIRDPSHFWVVRCHFLQKLTAISKRINKWCEHPESIKDIPSEIKKGEIYLVQFSVDSKWYRGRVESLVTTDPPDQLVEQDGEENRVDTPDEKYAEIFYIDFGNTEIVPISKMRKISNQFLDIPGTAKLCSLSSIEPINKSHWSPDAIKVFSNFVKEKEVYMQILEERNNILYVDLSEGASASVINDVPVSVRDALVFLEHGCFIKPEQVPKSRFYSNVKSFLPPEELRANTRVAVQISYVQSPSLLYVQQRATSRYFTDLLIEMQNVYSNDTSILYAVYVPYIGMICAAKFEKDDMWYRAKVIGLPGSTQVEVYYIDFGNKDVVPLRNLRKLLDRFCKMTMQAIMCKLADVTYPQDATGWSIEAKEWLSKDVSKRQLTLLSLGMLIGEQCIKAVLYDMQNDMEICINALLVQKGFAVSTGKFSSEVEKPRIKSQMPTPSSPPKMVQPRSPDTFSGPPDPVGSSLQRKERLSSFSDPEPEIPLAPPGPVLKHKEQPDDSLKVHVSYIESPGLFYIRIAGETEDKFIQLMKDMQKAYQNIEGGNIGEISVGKTFAAKKKSNGKWYRVVILSVESAKTVKARFVDYGYVESVNVDDLRVLSEQFKEKDNAFAISCQLTGILPAGDIKKWSRMAIDTFKDLIESHDTLLLVGEFDSYKEGKPLPCDLMYEEIIHGTALEPSSLVYSSLVSKLLDHGVALPIRRNKPVSDKPSAENSDSMPTQLEKNIDKSQPPTIRIPDLSNVRRKPCFTWLPARLPTKLKFTAVPTHVGDEGTIFLQVKPNGNSTKMAEYIRKVMETEFKDLPVEKLDCVPPVGEAVAARFKLDKKWYRAEIVRDKPEKILVQFVDYGNYELVSIEDIRLDICKQNIPRQCIECALYELRHAKVTNIPKEIFDLLHNTIVEQECEVTIRVPPKPGNKVLVSLKIIKGDNEVLQDIIDALTEKIPETSSCDSRSGVPMCTRVIDSLSAVKSIGFLKTSPLKAMELFKVCVTNLAPPNIICLQKLQIDEPVTDEEFSHNLELQMFLNLMEELSENAENYPEVIAPEPGLACCAQFSYDNRWYRCHVLEVSDDGVGVVYVDYGNCEVVPLTRLRKPKEDILEFPVQAQFCKPWGIEPTGGEWTDEIVLALQKSLMSSNEVYAKVIVPDEDFDQVEILIKDGEEMKLIYQDLIDEGLLTSCS